METHVRVVAILNIVLGSLGVLGGIMVLLIFGGLAAVVGMSQETPDRAVAVPIVLVVSVPVLIGGIGLLRCTPWSRVYMIVLSAIELLNVPLGTALGIYSIWTLSQPAAAALFTRRPYA